MAASDAAAKRRRLNEGLADPKLQQSSTGIRASTSGSRPSPSHGRGYEVFLSFRGADTRKGFTDCLYNSLRDAGVDVFRDNEELHVGEEIGPQLIDRIERSKISIPIFSKNYASSKWCLREFACMTECRKRMKQTMLPIFYDVTPNEVQHPEKGIYAEAFSKHVEDSKRNPRINVQKWRKALLEVGTLKGWDLQNDTNGHEGQLIKLVVRRVLSDLKKGHLILTEKLVSVDDKKRAIMRLLDVGKEDVRTIGVFGMGGIGKTTLAKVIYNEIMGYFDSCSFLKDIRATLLHFDGLKCLQNQLAADLSRCEDQDFTTTDEGTNELQRRFREKKVLVVLDDVDHSNQLEALVSVAWFAPGSRVIVTTRYKNALNLTPKELRYEVEEMKLDWSMELFCKHAFRGDSPTVELRALSNAIVKTTGGLPLALKVIGSFLCGKKKVIWEETLKKLKGKPHMEVQEKLRISYDSLEPEQKEIFLDIACHFIGEDPQVLFRMWEDCEFYPESGLDELILRSLVKIGEDNKLSMHDQLRDLGREIVRPEDVKKPGNRSRLWSNEEALSVLKEYKGSPYVEAICAEFPHYDVEHRRFTDQNFRNMSGLRFLQIDCAELDGDFKNLFTKLRYLRWRHSWPVCEPTNLDLTSLVVLDLSCSLVKHDWGCWRPLQVAPELKVLILQKCLLLTTLDFSLFPNLEVLILDGSRNLQEIDPSIRCLRSLRVLNMNFCEAIEELPPELCFLKSLELFSARHCSNLLKLFEGQEKLEALKELNLQECGKITKLPNLSNFRALRKLDVAKCYQLYELEGLEELVELEELFIGECTEIEKLPILSNLKALRKMHAGGCRKLRELEGLDGLVALEELDVDGCRKLRELEGLDGLVALEELNVEECTEIEKLPNLSNLKALREMHAGGCQKLRELEGLDGLVALEELDVFGCTEIEKLPNLSNLKALRKIYAGGCRKLRELEGLDGLVALEELVVFECTEIEKLPNLSNLKALRKIYTGGCRKLRELEGLDGLVALEELDVFGCTEIEKLPNLSNLKALRKIYAGGCRKLRELEGLVGLVALEELLVFECTEIEKLPNLSNLKALRKMHAGGCRKLRELEGLDGLVALEELNVDGCIEIEKLTNLANLKALTTMHRRMSKVMRT
ncbi:TMV resistance protein N-like isoform X2 [Punica granatum]|uniref:TMV resistance protein N-like isoform X2 n=1 Tax=Punica granatum TaxID=22663 RepID=A0A6P8DRG7_PUNGR|nr:TMV resistance protein N-like isoform X2 [Punica granatum]